MEIAREFQKNIYFCFTDCTKASDCVDHTNCGKFLKRWEYQTILPVSWEICMQVKELQLEPDMETDWFKIEEGVHQGYILSPCLSNFDAEYIVQNAGLDESQGGIKIAGKNINNLWYADDTTLMAESKEKEMTIHSSVIAWRIPGTREPGGLPSMGLHRVGHDWSDLAVAAAPKGN